MAVRKDQSAKKQKVVDVLNRARSMELFAIAQYMQQHYRLDDDDYAVLAANMRKIAIDEMKHAEEFAERIKDLGAIPTQDHSAKAILDQDVYKIYPYDSDVELDTLDKYNDFAAVCRENGDIVSMRLFERIIEDEQRHQTYFDDTATHIKTMDKSFLAKVAGTDVGGEND
ncbi:Bacterioferritin [uncultured delta proteobacterium]|uniref:Bacterioferritin n=1 Tax=uncultured delta proteobacterium TaxID=34034 RepID=A0A212JUF5_9DELT|nr:Bacterioferritin [uncultured delta proteobacterium]